jgi:hypothetical protein
MGFLFFKQLVYLEEGEGVTESNERDAVSGRDVLLERGGEKVVILQWFSGGRLDEEFMIGKRANWVKYVLIDVCVCVGLLDGRGIEYFEWFEFV